MVQPLSQLEHGVHEELGVAGNHGIDGVLPDDVSIKTNQALKDRTNDLRQNTISSYFEFADTEIDGGSSNNQQGKGMRCGWVYGIATLQYLVTYVL